MKKKIPVSDKRKKFIRESFSKINPDKLRPSERNYYNKVKAGKARAAIGDKFNGKYLTKDLKKLIQDVAAIRKESVKEYLSNEKNVSSIKRFIANAKMTIQRSQDKIFDDLVEMNSNKHVNINDGNGIIKVKSADLLEQMLLFNQIAKSNLSIVDIRFKVETYPDGKIVYEIPNYEKFLEIIKEENPDQLLDYLDEEEIFYIMSDEDAKK